jgi:long-subunit fatty acid transport protein
MEDTTTYTLGLGQRLAANWSGFVAVAYDKRSDKAALSPLRPTDGRLGYTVGVSYQQGQFKLTPWLSYQRLGSVDISSGGTTLAAFDAESATAFGIRLGYQF